MTESTQSQLQSKLQHEYCFKIGEKIATRYEVQSTLGVGGFAEVYKCYDARLKRVVAVKVLTKGELKEEIISAQLDHPNIVDLYDVTVNTTPTILVFRFVDGVSLEEFLSKTPYRRLNLSETVLKIFHQIASALDHAHKQGIIHRDIKPSNILLDQENNAYLTDFGLASIKQQSVSGLSVVTKDAREMLSGTVPYMAPEQILEKIQGNESSDLYSFGVVVYEMLTGRLPYQGRDTRLIIQIANGDILPPSVANPELPKGIEPVLLKVLSREPLERFSNGTEFVKELERVSKSYATANTLYEQALESVEKRKWRDAQAVFERLEKQAPGHKDTPMQLEQVRQKVRLLDLSDKAESLLKEKQYKEALKTLELLEQIDPDYQISDLRKQALIGREEEDKRSLAELYQQAVTLFQSGDYQATLDTLAVIYQRNPGQSDPENIGTQAQEKVDYQKHLRQLYNWGVDQSRKEEWADALQIFEELNEKQPGYEDVNLRLSTVLHFHELSSLLEKAKTHLQEHQFAACIDTLDEITRKNKNYKPADIAYLRQDAVEKLFRHSQTLVKEQNFEDTLVALNNLRQRKVSYPGLDELDNTAREGLRKQKLYEDLNRLYQRAVAELEQEAYLDALKTWSLLQQKQEDIAYPDPNAVASRSKGGLYNAAFVALKEGNHEQALALLQQIRDFDPDYKDTKNVETIAKAAIDRKVMVRQWAVRIGVGLVVILLLWIGGNVLFDGNNETTPTPTPTIEPSSSKTLLPLLTISVSVEDIRCEGDQKIQPISIQASGGDGRYTYFWEGQKIDTVVNAPIPYEITITDNNLRGKVQVLSGDGQSAETTLFIPSVECDP